MKRTAFVACVLALAATLAMGSAHASGSSPNHKTDGTNVWIGAASGQHEGAFQLEGPGRRRGVHGRDERLQPLHEARHAGPARTLRQRRADERHCLRQHLQGTRFRQQHHARRACVRWAGRRRGDGRQGGFREGIPFHGTLLSRRTWRHRELDTGNRLGTRKPARWCSRTMRRPTALLGACPLAPPSRWSPAVPRLALAASILRPAPIPPRAWRSTRARHARSWADGTR